MRYLYLFFMTLVRGRLLVFDLRMFYTTSNNHYFFTLSKLVMMVFFSGSIDLHIIGHANAVELWRRMLGPTSVYKGQFEDPYCLRGIFGISDTRNVAHGSGNI